MQIKYLIIQKYYSLKNSETEIAMSFAGSDSDTCVTLFPAIMFHTNAREAHSLPGVITDAIVMTGIFFTLIQLCQFKIGN